MFQPLFLLSVSTLLVVTAAGKQEADERCAFFKATNGCPAGCILGESLYCGAVPPGFFSEEGSINFAPCPSGLYNPEYGSVSCLPCPVGAFAEDIGSTFCRPCPAKTYQDKSGQNKCKPCESFTYSEEGVHHMNNTTWGLEFCEVSSNETTIPVGTSASMVPSMSPTSDSMTKPPSATKENGSSSDKPDDKSDNGWPKGFLVAASSAGILGAAGGVLLCASRRSRNLEDDRAAAISTTATAGNEERSHHVDGTPYAKNNNEPEAAIRNDMPSQDRHVVIDLENQDIFEGVELEIVGHDPVPQFQQDLEGGLNFISPFQPRYNNEHVPRPPSGLPTVSPWNAEDEKESEFSCPDTEESKTMENLNHYEFLNVHLDEDGPTDEENPKMDSDDDCYTEELNDSTAAIMSPGSAAWRAQGNDHFDSQGEDDTFSGFDLEMSPMSGASKDY